MAAIAHPRIPPGPPGEFLIGSARRLQGDFVQGLLDGWREYGDVMRFRMPKPYATLYLVAHPDYVQHVLQANHRNYLKTPFVDKAWHQAVGEGLICSKGDFWLRQRRLSQPAFHRQRIAAYATMMADSTLAMLDGWKDRAQDGRPVDMRVEMQHLTLEVLAKALFTSDWSREADLMGRAVTIRLERLYKRVESPFDVPEWIPTKANRLHQKAGRILDRIVYSVIAERRRTGVDTGDLVSMLMAARDEDTGESMSDEQIHDEVVTMIFGGHETVSTGLTWMWYLLSKHPEVWSRLQAELGEVLGGRPPTVQDIPRLRYTTMIVEESMRLYPPVWLMSRTPQEDDEIGGYHVPAGTMVLVCPFVTHRHPDFWEDPEGFDPERFTPERVEGRHRYQYFPFSGGPRKCIGDSFGMLEMQIIIATVAQHYRPSVVPGHPVVPQPGITLRARYGVPMTLERVQAPARGAPVAAAIPAGTADQPASD